MRRFLPAIFTTLSVLAAGCQNDLFRAEETPFTAPDNALKAIEPVDLSSATYGPPVPAEDAVAQATAGSFRATRYERTRTLSIAEVRALALANNLDLRVQLVAPDIAKASITEEEAKFNSLFYADYSRNGSNLLTQLQNNEGLFSDQVKMGVAVPLATGGVVKFQPQYTQSGQLVNGTNDTDQGGVLMSISQPLLRDAGVGVATASIRVSKLQGQITDSRTKLEAIRILANADKAYWNQYRTFRELEVRKQQYDLAIAQLDRAQRRVDNGDAPQVEVLRAQSGVGATLENLILADAALRNRQRDLKRIMNDPDMPMSDGCALIPATQPNPLGLQLDANTLADGAVRNRMEMLELELQLAVDATNVEVARNGTLPLFTVDYTYQMLGAGSGVSDSFGNLGDADQYQVAAHAEIPIGNEARMSQLRRAVLQRVQRMATKDARALAIRQEVLNAVDAIDTSWQRILAARLESILAARTYEAEKRQFDVGLRTSTDVLEAASKLGDSQTREVNALAGYEIALIDAAFATGTVVGGSRVRWDELRARDPAVVPETGNDGVIEPVTTLQPAASNPQAAAPVNVPVTTPRVAPEAAPVAAPAVVPAS
ncbi:MAG: TolC family protein [Planctomycetota bacterium]|nr:MAG: TolC family protein [Planctomycetota bacterium]